MSDCFKDIRTDPLCKVCKELDDMGEKLCAALEENERLKAEVERLRLRLRPEEERFLVDVASSRATPQADRDLLNGLVRRNGGGE